MFLIERIKPTIKLYIVTDEDGDSFLFWTYPKRRELLGYWGTEKNDILQGIPVSPEHFPNVKFPTWHDEPVAIEVDLSKSAVQQFQSK